MIDAIERKWKIPLVALAPVTIFALVFAVVIAGIGALIATRTISKKTASELIRVC